MKSIIKLNLRLLAFSVFVLSFSAVAQTASPKVENIACSADANGVLHLPALKIKAKLASSPQPEKQKIKCERVVWEKKTFIGVRYTNQKLISYASRLQDVTEYEIIYLSPKGARYMASAPIDGYSTAWMIENKHLVLRVVKLLAQGKTELLEGYLFDPKTEQFSDLGAFAYRNNWTTKTKQQ